MTTEQAAKDILCTLQSIDNLTPTEKRHINKIWQQLKRLYRPLPPLQKSYPLTVEPTPTVTVTEVPVYEKKETLAEKLKGLNAAQIKGWAKSREGKTKDALIEVAKEIGIDTNGTIDQLTESIYEAINQ